jgi:predicted nucleotidyltransferase
MELSSVDSQVRSAVGEICADTDVVFAVGFGSQFSGEATQSFDCDLAIKFVNELSASERFEKRCFFSGELQHEKHPFIDVADIESLPLAVAHDAVNGEFLCGDEQTFERFRKTVVAEFVERREELRDQQRAVIDRIAEDGLRG